MEKIKWLDIKGNYDVFNILSLDSIKNYYRKYFVVCRDGFFYYVYSIFFGNYLFICVDVIVNLGFKRFYNFFGILDKKKMEEFLLLVKESSWSNYIIWFGYFIIFIIFFLLLGIWLIMSLVIVYLCGYFYIFGGLMFVLYICYF